LAVRSFSSNGCQFVTDVINTKWLTMPLTSLQYSQKLSWALAFVVKKKKRRKNLRKELRQMHGTTSLPLTLQFSTTKLSS
jgi:hypothetical protein